MPDYAGRNRYQPITDALYVVGPAGGFVNVWTHRPIGIYQDTQDLNAGAVVFTHAVAANTERINFVSIHFAGVLVLEQQVTVTLIFAGAATHNAVVVLTLLSPGIANWIWIPDNDIIIETLDSVTLNCSNNGVPAINAYSTISMEEYI